MRMRHPFQEPEENYSDRRDSSGKAFRRERAWVSEDKKADWEVESIRGLARLAEVRLQ